MLSRPALVAGALLVLLSLAPSASALVIQGHSPITVLLKAPNNQGQFGCTSGSCSCPSTSPCTTTDTGNDFSNTISPSSLCTSLCSYSYDSGTGVTTIVVPDITGTWTLTYFGTSVALPSSPFTVLAFDCPESGNGVGDAGNPNSGHNEPGCQAFCPGGTISGFSTLCDQDDMGAAIIIISGDLGSCASNPSGCSTQFNYPLSLPIGTPEFPLGFIAALAVAFLGLLLIRKVNPNP